MFEFIRDSKPIKDIEILIDALLPFSQIAHLKSNQRYELAHNGEDICWLILKGSLTVRRATDDLIMCRMTPPAILGLALITYPSTNLYLQVDDRSEVATLPIEVLESTLDKYQLWKSVASVQAYVTQALVIRESTLVVRSAYEIICNQLHYLMGEPIQHRRAYTVTNYILQRTHISRSSIVKILRQLQDGGYIVMKNNKLVSINSLPEGY